MQKKSAKQFSKIRYWTPRVIILALIFTLTGCAQDRAAKRQVQIDELQKKFSWWPTDAKPGPVKDDKSQGYWWWPNEPGKARPWGNRGYCYVYKVIFDYKEDELPAPKAQELRPSLLIKKILKNVKVYFGYNRTKLRDDAKEILDDAAKTLKRNPEADILITGNCDIRGSELYNEKLGRKRADSVKQYMLEKGIDAGRIRIVSRGKLDAVAHVNDLVGMQKDRNAQFMIAEVEEVMIPYTGPESKDQLPVDAKPVEEGKYIQESKEEVESQVRVNTREYTVQNGDSLWKIAQKELGSGHRWKNIYELNKDKLKSPEKLKKGLKLLIPVE